MGMRLESWMGSGTGLSVGCDCKASRVDAFGIGVCRASLAPFAIFVCCMLLISPLLPSTRVVRNRKRRHAPFYACLHLRRRLLSFQRMRDRC